MNLWKNILPVNDNRLTLDLSTPDYDYRPVKGMGKDRDNIPEPIKLICLIRQRGICAYCCTPLTINVQGKCFCIYARTKFRAGELDHGIPVWQGGRDDYRIMCYLCSYHNGFEFKSGGIELHGAFSAARLGQTTKEDWKVMLQAFITSGLQIYAIPFWWYMPTLPRRLNLPGYNMDSGKLDLTQTFAVEKTWYDRNIQEFLNKSKFNIIKKIILPELANHDKAYS